MEKDLDIKLYNEYLDGEKGAFELLYNKYKDKIQYFVYNIVKDYQKAEDITQDVFIYVMQNKIKEGYTFKYYIYLVAKSRAYNQINMEKRRTEINEDYILNGVEQVGQDVANIVTKNEKRKEILNAIDMLDDRYKNAIYLVKIEELTYQETAQILGESIQNVKNLIHRGKKELRKILIKKGFDEMNKVSKVIIAILCISVLFAGGVYATIKIIESFTGKAEITPTYTSKISSLDSNKIWAGTFNLVWNDLMNDVVGGPIEFENGKSELAEELNKQTFTVKELSEDSYYKIHGVSTYELKAKIENGIKTKFNETSKVLDNVEWGNPESYTLYAMLKKEFNFIEKFAILPDATFGNSTEKIKYFGINSSTPKEVLKNIEVLFYNSKEDFAIKLKTKEGEEVYLYKTTGEGKSFEENFQYMKKHETKNTKKIEEGDILKIPFIKINDEISYDELCGKAIKGTDWTIAQALQNIDFELNNVGGSVKSEALIELRKSVETTDRLTNTEYIFDSDFILYLKEENKDKPYLALKVDNNNVLVAGESNEMIENTDLDNNTEKPINVLVKEIKDDYLLGINDKNEEVIVHIDENTQIIGLGIYVGDYIQVYTSDKTIATTYPLQVFNVTKIVIDE